MRSKSAGQAAQSRVNPSVFPEIASGPDYGPAELHKRHTVVVEGDPTGRRQGASHHARVVDQLVIDRLYLKRDKRKHAAAIRLLEAFTRAGMSPLLTIDFARAGTGKAASDWTTGQLSAKRAVNDALKAISPLGDIIWDVVLCDRTLTEIELMRRWPKSTAAVILDLGLEALARHYESMETRR